jgi:hypothetical protein
VVGEEMAGESMASVASATDYGTGGEYTAHCMCHETIFEDSQFLSHNDIKKLFENRII